MHPEIKSEKPGICPKCGMKLVKLEKREIRSDTSYHEMEMMMPHNRGMANINHQKDKQQPDNMNMMKGMGFLMILMMGVMVVVLLVIK